MFVSHTYPDKNEYRFCGIKLGKISKFDGTKKDTILCPKNRYGGLDINNSNDVIFIKFRIDAKLSEALKKILDKKKLTQQDLMEMKVKEYVLDNLNFLIEEKASK